MPCPYGNHPYVGNIHWNRKGDKTISLSIAKQSIALSSPSPGRAITFYGKTTIAAHVTPCGDSDNILTCKGLYKGWAVFVSILQMRYIVHHGEIATMSKLPPITKSPCPYTTIIFYNNSMIAAG